jgi:hypothetical protein
MESDREKGDKNEFGCIHFTATFEFEYGYPYLCFSGYKYQIIQIPFPYFHPSAKGARKRACSAKGRVRHGSRQRGEACSGEGREMRAAWGGELQ